VKSFTQLSVESYKPLRDKNKMAIIATVSSLFTVALATGFAIWMVTQLFKND